MGISHWFRLYSACFKVARWAGLRACFRFMTGALVLDEDTLKSCNFPVGGSDA